MIGGTIVGVVYVPGAVQEPMNILKAEVLTGAAHNFQKWYGTLYYMQGQKFVHMKM